MKRPPEMSRKQFKDALARNGFKQIILWITDTTGVAPGISWGVVMHRDGRTAYRATLAMVLRERKAIEEKGSRA